MSSKNFTTTTPTLTVAAAMNSSTYNSDTHSPTTTFVQADPSTFRAIVQTLTGISQTPPTQKHPLPFPTKPTTTTTPAPASAAAEMGPRKPPFKLHERRQRKLEIQLKDSSFTKNNSGFLGNEMIMVSPASPFDLFSFGSPKTPSLLSSSPCEEEDRAIAEKGFYLHPSQLSNSRGSEPELLPLFPLHSPRDDHQSS